ncbi:MAG: DUF2059 domain-containing protein [Flavobacteriales bacterium]|nr:DUF2059 domain-containing protein [Flavobacteriales bacterium]
MKKILVLILIAGCSALLGNYSSAQSKSEDLKRLFELMQTDKMIDQTMSNMTDMIKQQLQGYSEQLGGEKKFDEYMAFLLEETRSITRKMMTEDMPALYEKYFTQEEIKDLIRFYESKTGQKMIESSAALSKETMQIMMQKYVPELQEKLKAKLADMD